MSFRALRGMTVFRMIDDVFQEAVPPENYHYNNNAGHFSRSEKSADS
ncbi:MAG: hypothetical protein GX102_01205 [Porphyromonadaceae bacterium]|jgi:hypothetical protein|nr:hypothetical protein [Porphyromonadaceae bacterium]